MSETEPAEIWRETIRKEWTDYNGHMNLAYYIVVFDHATDRFYDRVGLGEDYHNRTNCSTFNVESHTLYLGEVMEGAEVWCSTQLVDFDEKRLHYFHRMYQASEGFLAATTELMAVHVDMAQRKVAPMPADVMQNLADTLSDHSRFPKPEQVGRVMGIRR